jgi:hypothetical protein
MTNFTSIVMLLLFQFYSQTEELKPISSTFNADKRSQNLLLAEPAP